MVNGFLNFVTELYTYFVCLGDISSMTCIQHVFHKKGMGLIAYFKDIFAINMTKTIDR